MDLVVQFVDLLEGGSIRTPQPMWVLGYASFAAVMWYLFLEAMSRGWRFRCTYLAGALHITVVSVWSALVAIDSGIPQGIIDALISVTTTTMIIATIHGIRSNRSL